MELTCPHCEKTVVAEPDRTGPYVRCPNCKRLIEIPEAEPTLPAMSQEQQEEQTELLGAIVKELAKLARAHEDMARFISLLVVLAIVQFGLFIVGGITIGILISAGIM